MIKIGQIFYSIFKISCRCVYEPKCIMRQIGDEQCIIVNIENNIAMTVECLADCPTTTLYERKVTTMVDGTEIELDIDNIQFPSKSKIHNT